MNKKSGYLFTDACTIISIVLVLVLSLVMASCEGPEMIGRALQEESGYYMPDPVMGDWEVWLETEYGDESKFAAQAIAMGDAQYRFQFLNVFDKGTEPIVVLNGELKGRTFAFEGEGMGWSGTGTGTIRGDRFTGTFKGSSSGKFEMLRVVRPSPALGAKPPAGAIVLFDGENLDKWKHPKDTQGRLVKWKLVNGAMEVSPGAGSIVTKKEFKDFELHLEFRVPFMPSEHGQDRGNSGVYFQGRYEVQILDSYALEGRDNECGGIYKVAPPLVNMCAPPMQWQTYDIIFHAPRFDDTGEKTQNAHLTALHNGVKIHDGTEVPGPTESANYSAEIGLGSIYLQDHGNPVQYRNIWLVELQG